MASTCEAFAEFLREGTTCMHEWRKRLPMPIPTPEQAAVQFGAVAIEAESLAAEYQAMLADDAADVAHGGHSASDAEKVAPPAENA
jgi:hypothetical protein